MEDEEDQPANECNQTAGKSDECFHSLGTDEHRLNTDYKAVVIQPLESVCL